VRQTARFAENRDFCLLHLHSMPPLGDSCRNIAIRIGVEKLEWCGFWQWKKNWRYVYSIVLTESTNVTDRQTNTARQHRPRLCIASRGNNSTRSRREIVCKSARVNYKKLISRWDRRTLPLEPRHRCTSSLPSSCLRNDVLTSRLQAACLQNTPQLTSQCYL